MNWWTYEALERRAPYDWSPATRGDRPWDQLDYHLDLGCGRVPKGRLGIDKRHSAWATDLVIDLDTLNPSHSHAKTREHYLGLGLDYPMQREPHRLPLPDESIKSIITHHAFEHIGSGFEKLMEECYRVLEWNGVMRIIVPCFPSTAAVAEYDHKRYFMEQTFQGFCQEPGAGPSYTDGFAERYNSCCFRQVDLWSSPPASPEKMWTTEDSRELRVTLWKAPEGASTPPDPSDYMEEAA